VAPLAAGEAAAADHFYKVKADQAAGPLGAAQQADAILFLSDVPGVKDASGRTLETLTPNTVAVLQRKGVVGGGMIPKVEAAVAALTASPPQTLIKIATASGEDAILEALRPDHGTTFVSA
jgi:acetylglutamate kinase